MFLAPGSELAHVLDRGEIGTDTLVGFEHDPGDVLRAQVSPVQSRDEEIETGVLSPVTVGKRDLDDRRVFIDDPGFLTGNAARLLSTQSAAMEAAFSADNADLFLTPLANAVGAGEFDGAFRGLRTSGEE